MCEGRSFEQIDDMTLFDIMMMREYREENPSTDSLVAAIAQWCGVYKPSTSSRAAPIDRAPDPRDSIRKAFAGVNLKNIEGAPHVL